MWTCKACKQTHSDMRQTCPVFGTRRPTKAVRERQTTTREYCDVCAKPVVQEQRCDTCDGIFHAKCLKSHAKACYDRAMEADFQDWSKDWSDLG